MEQNQKVKVAINPLNSDFVVPGQGTSELFFGQNRMTISNDALNAIFQELEVSVIEINEPQIAGVTDEDIKDDSEPVKFEDITDVNEVDRTEDIVVEDTADLVTE